MSADTPKRKNLGRGLSALFGEQQGSATPANMGSSSAYDAPIAVASTRLPVDLLRPSPLQPRRRFEQSALNELSASIAEKGILQPLLVRADPQKPGHYEIVAGERRWRASQQAKVHDVPVHVAELSDSEVLEVALIENLQRQDLSPVEEARGYRALLDDFEHTQEQVAGVVGKSRAHVANSIRLLSLPESVLSLLDMGEITVGQARPLIGLDSAADLASKIVKGGLSARQAERMARGFRNIKRPTRRAKDPDIAALEENLEQTTGYSVKIGFDGKGGSVSIAYATLEQLDDIVNRLSGGGRSKFQIASPDQVNDGSL